jgi:intergrase/recombinase
MAPVDEAQQPVDLPNKEQLKKGFEAQHSVLAKAVYLLIATTGLRKCEILALQKQNLNTKLRSVIANHYTRKKRSGITFYNSECEEWLNKYLEIETRRDNNDPKLFVVSDRQFRKIWRLASKSAQTKITPKILRKWFSTEMGEQLIPDRFIDIFQGRAPRSVLAKHYTGKELLRLKRIYEKANLKVLA